MGCKRTTRPRSRRARRTGQSPYHRHKKAPIQYSAAYYAWRNSILRKSRQITAEDKVERQRRVEAAEFKRDKYKLAA